MEKVKVSFQSLIEQDGNSEEIKFKSEGKLGAERDYSLLKFDEPGENDVITKNTIYFNEKEIIYIREDAVYHEMNFRRLKNSSGVYQISGVEIPLDIFLDEFEVTYNELTCGYKLYISDEFSGHFRINIKFEKECN